MTEQRVGRGRHRGAGPVLARRAGRHAAASTAPRTVRQTCALLLSAAAVGCLTAMASLALWAGAPAAWGWRPVLVVGDSMNPGVVAGDVIVTSPYDAALLDIGHIVLFERPGFTDGSLVTHRIEAKLADGTFITRGDANREVDSSPVGYDQIRGVVRLRVPMIGLPMIWLRHGQWAPLTGWAVATFVMAGLAVNVRGRP